MGITLNSQEAKDAVYKLAEQYKNNGNMLSLNLILEEYSAAENKVEWLYKNSSRTLFSLIAVIL